MAPDPQAPQQQDDNAPAQLSTANQPPGTTKIENGIAYDISGKALGPANMDQQPKVDYKAIAAQMGGTPKVDYKAVAAQMGGVPSGPAKKSAPQQTYDLLTEALAAGKHYIKTGGQSMIVVDNAELAQAKNASDYIYNNVLGKNTYTHNNLTYDETPTSAAGKVWQRLWGWATQDEINKIPGLEPDRVTMLRESGNDLLSRMMGPQNAKDFRQFVEDGFSIPGPYGMPVSSKVLDPIANPEVYARAAAKSLTDFFSPGYYALGAFGKAAQGYSKVAQLAADSGDMAKAVASLSKARLLAILSTGVNVPFAVSQAHDLVEHWDQMNVPERVAAVSGILGAALNAHIGVQHMGGYSQVAHDAIADTKATAQDIAQSKAAQATKKAVGAMVTLGKAPTFDESIQRASQLTGKKFRQQQANIKNASPELQAVAVTNPNAETPGQFADSIRNWLQDREQVMLQASGGTKDSDTPVSSTLEKDVRQRLDKFFDDNRGRYGNDEQVEAAKEQIMSRLLLQSKAQGAPPSLRMPNAFEAENMRKGLNEEIKPQINGQPVTAAYKAAVMQTVPILRESLDKFYDTNGIRNVKEFRAKEATMIDVAERLEAAEKRAQEMGNGSIWSSLVKKFSVPTIITSIALGHNPLAFGALAPYLMGERAYQNYKNPGVNVRRAMDLAEPQAITDIDVLPRTVQGGPSNVPTQGPVQPPPVVGPSGVAHNGPPIHPTKAGQAAAAVAAATMAEPATNHALNSQLATHFGEPLDHAPLDDRIERVKNDAEAMRRSGIDIGKTQTGKMLGAINEHESEHAAKIEAEQQKAHEDAAKVVQDLHTEFQKLQEENRKKISEGGKPEAGKLEQSAFALPYETTDEELPESKFGDKSYSGVNTRLHELGHLIWSHEMGLQPFDVISAAHEESGGAHAVARTDISRLLNPDGSNNKEAFKANLGDLVSRFLAGAVAEDVHGGIPLNENASAATDVAQVKKIFDALEVPEADRKRITQQSVAQLREAFSKPEIAEIMNGFAAKRKAGLGPEYHFDETQVHQLRQALDATKGEPNGTTEKGPGVDRTARQQGRGVGEKPVAGREGGSAPEPGRLNQAAAGLVERTTGDEDFDAAIRNGGGVPAGFMNVPGHGDYRMFHDPETGSTLAFKPHEAITPQTVGKKLAASRAEFEMGEHRRAEREAQSRQEEPEMDRTIRLGAPAKAAQELQPKQVVEEKQKTSDRLVEKYGTTNDPHKAGFILSDGRVVPLTQEHDIMINAAEGKVGGFGPPRRADFINDEQAIRTRYRVTRGGPEVIFSVPKQGVTPEQVDQIKKSVGKLRNGNVVMEVSEGEGKSAKKEFARVSDVEPMLKEIGAHPDMKGAKLQPQQSAALSKEDLSKIQRLDVDERGKAEKGIIGSDGKVHIAAKEHDDIALSAYGKDMTDVLREGGVRFATYGPTSYVEFASKSPETVSRAMQAIHNLPRTNVEIDYYNPRGDHKDAFYSHGTPAQVEGKFRRWLAGDVDLQPKKNAPATQIAEDADRYNRRFGRPAIDATIKPHNVEYAKRVADAFDAMKHEPENPAVKKSYEAMAQEVRKQWDHAVNDMGMKFEPWTKEGQPYANSKEMVKDVRDNKHLYFFQGGDIKPESPMAKVDPKTGLSYNDMFRAVHDLFGHAAHGFEFGPKGEENAYLVHRQMFPAEAIPALTSETRGQNSWVNFGKHLRNESGGIPKKGERGYVPPTERPYAEQKVGLLPEEFHSKDTALEGTKISRLSKAAEKDPVNTAQEFLKDEKGEPMVFYHGSPTKAIEKLEFRPGKNSTIFGFEPIERAGLFVTPDENFAKEFAGKNGEVTAHNLNIKKPVDLREGISTDFYNEMEQHGLNPRWLLTAQEPWEMFDGDDGKTFVKALKSAGYDGAIINEPNTEGKNVTSYIAFSPEQISKTESRDWAAGIEKAPFGGVNPNNPEAPSKTYGFEIAPEHRHNPDALTAEEARAYAERPDVKAALAAHPDVKLGWDTTTQGPELNIGASTDDLDTAKKIAGKLDQRAIVNTQTGEEIPAGGEGKKTAFPEYPLADRLKDLDAGKLEKAAWVPPQGLEKGIPRDEAVDSDIPLSKLSVSERQYNQAAADNSRGRGSKTEGPVSIVYNPDNKQFLVEDGVHRIVQAHQDGQETIPAKIWSGYSDIANVRPENKIDLSRLEKAKEEPREFAENPEGFKHIAPQVLQHLEPDEQAFIKDNKRAQAQIQKHYDEIKPTIDETKAAMQAGQALSGWWRRYIDAFNALGEHTNEEVATKLGPKHSDALKVWHAAVSGNKSVENANKIAWGSYADWLDKGMPRDRSSINRILVDNGAVTDVHFPRSSKKAGQVKKEGLDTTKLFRLVNSPEMRQIDPTPFHGDVFDPNRPSPIYGVTTGARKIPSMGATVAGEGNLNRLVLDTHMLDYFGEKKWTDNKYLAFSAHIRQAARELGLQPGEGQEQIWGTVLGIKQLLYQGLPDSEVPDELTNNLIEGIGKDYAQIIKDDPELSGIFERLKAHGIDPGGSRAQERLAAILERKQPAGKTPANQTRLVESAARIRKNLKDVPPPDNTMRFNFGANALKLEQAPEDFDWEKATPEQAIQRAKDESYANFSLDEVTNGDPWLSQADKERGEKPAISADHGSDAGFLHPDGSLSMVGDSYLHDVFSKELGLEDADAFTKKTGSGTFDIWRAPGLSSNKAGLAVTLAGPPTDQQRQAILALTKHLRAGEPDDFKSVHISWPGKDVGVEFPTPGKVAQELDNALKGK